MRQQYDSGFSLIEALVSTAILSGIVVAGATFYSVNSNSYARGQSLAATRQNARVALETMAREIRVAGYDISGVRGTLVTVAAIQAASSTSVTFVADVNTNGVLDLVTYRQQGTMVLRDLAPWNGAAFPASTTGEVSDNVASLTLTYFNKAGGVIAAPVATGSLQQIARVRIAVVTTVTTMGETDSFPLLIDVRIRNIT